MPGKSGLPRPVIAVSVPVTDSGGYFTGTNVEDVLQEVAADLVASHFATARSTAAPNATIPAHSLTAQGAESHIDAVFAPLGNGALLRRIPDGTATGGNKRGLRAVDWQAERTDAAQVALGDDSVIAGGRYNTVTGSGSVISGGQGNACSGIVSVIAGGNINSNSASYSTIGGGYQNSITFEGETGTIGGGGGNTVDAQYGTIPGGVGAVTRGAFGRASYASGIFATAGDAQIGDGVQRAATTDATATICTSDGYPAGVQNNVYYLPDNHAYLVEGRIIARSTGGDVKAWKIEAAVKRGGGAASVAIVDTPAYTVLAQDTGASAWAVSLVANTTRGSVEVQVTGAAATTIHWVAHLHSVEVG